MEKLKSAVPETLKRMIGESTPSDLPRTCSSLLDFLLHFHPFHLMVEDLAEPEKGLCGKNKDEALLLKKKGNQCFSVGDSTTALAYYSQALRVAPMDADEMGKNLVATLYMNRASVLHKMNLMAECLRDCDHALQISPSYSKAWYRRGRANASLGNYEDAIHDLNVAKVVELSPSGKQQIESELKRILDGCNNTIQHTKDKLNIVDESHQIELQCVTTPDKARGIASKTDILPASLIHTEEPFAAVILKQCRDTHCHYCFNELPADKVPCASCSIALYCSKHCQLQAGGVTFQNNQKNHGIQEISSNLEKHIAEVTLVAFSETDTKCIPEHKHECQGVNWPAILPPEIVLAGRVLVKSILDRGGSLDNVNLRENLDLSHHYSAMPPESKLELHIYSIVLLRCLEHFNGFELQISGFSIEQVVILVSQIRVNSMTVVRMKSNEDHGLVDQFGNHSPRALTSNVEQVKVAQAIYKTGSLFNHSCQPNIHVYFLSRTLFIRATEFVAAGCALELSYGPQVGQWGCKDRIRFLEDEYSFRCHCSGCSEVNLSDLVLNAFHCVKQKCSGVVLEKSILDCEKHKIKHFCNIPSSSPSEPHIKKVCNFTEDAIHYVAQDAFFGSLPSVNPEYCLKCGSYCDLESSSAAVSKAWKHIRRFQDALGSEDVSSTMISDALKCLDLLRSTLHAYNKSIAEVEDSLAQAFCLVGDLPRAMDHCKASIEILEKLYNPNHIVIGYELVKLASIQLSSGKSRDAVDTINAVGEIFSRYYGSQADIIFPYLQVLRKQTR